MSCSMTTTVDIIRKYGIAQNPRIGRRSKCSHPAAACTPVLAMTVLPFPEYAPDLSPYAEEESNAIINAFPRKDGYGPVPPLQTSPGPPCGLQGHVPGAEYADGSITIFAATRRRLWRIKCVTQLDTVYFQGHCADIHIQCHAGRISASRRMGCRSAMQSCSRRTVPCADWIDGRHRILCGHDELWSIRSEFTDTLAHALPEQTW